MLDSGGFAVVFDMGDGYKSLCENMGGVYLDGETLRFNPFANITDIDQSAERVRDQLSVMASPNGNLDEVHEGLLLQAVRASWLAKENRARIDDVVDFLKNASDSEQYAGSPTIRSRLDEMIVLLDQYTANGTYGRYFNSDEPSLRDDARMVVLELGGLEDRPSLLVAVMFSLIIYIENRMYRTPRTLKKLNVIDEGWRLLDFKNRKVGEFIQKVTAPVAVIPVPISPSHRTSSTLTLTRHPAQPVRHGVTPPTKLSSNRVRRSSRNITSYSRISSSHCSAT